MRPSTRVIVLAILFLAPTVLVPVASAEWSQLHRWSWRDARQNLAWALDENEQFHFATVHEKEFLLYEEGTGFNLSTWFVRPFSGIERVAVANISGEWGILWLDQVPKRAYAAGERSEMHFAWPVGEAEVAVTSFGGAFPPWHERQVDPETGVLHFLRVDGATATRYSIDPRAWDLSTGEAVLTGEGDGWSLNSARVLTSTGRLHLLPNGSVFGVEWDTDGLRAVTWDGRGEPERQELSTFWDYQDTRLTHTTNGTLAALVSYRRDACDLYVKAPDANWSSSRVEACPLTNRDIGLHAFRLAEDAPLRALTNRGFWSPGMREPVQMPCNDAPSGWTWRPDGREFILGVGPSVWERLPAPNVTVSADPAPEVPTGFAVKLRLDGNLSALTDPVVKWSFPDARAEGRNVTHAFLAPGNVTVRAHVESGAEGCRSTVATATLPLQVTGADRSAPPPSEAAPAPADADATASGNESGGFPVPAPALPVVLLALVAALALARRRA